MTTATHVSSAELSNARTEKRRKVGKIVRALAQVLDTEQLVSIDTNKTLQ